jgi:hypothetical protein
LPDSTSAYESSSTICWCRKVQWRVPSITIFFGLPCERASERARERAQGPDGRRAWEDVLSVSGQVESVRAHAPRPPEERLRALSPSLTSLRATNASANPSGAIRARAGGLQQQHALEPAPAAARA